MCLPLTFTCLLGSHLFYSSSCVVTSTQRPSLTPLPNPTMEAMISDGTWRPHSVPSSALLNVQGEERLPAKGSHVSFTLFGCRTIYLYLSKLPVSFRQGVVEPDFSPIWGTLVKSFNVFFFVLFLRPKVKILPLPASWTILRTKSRWCESQNYELILHWKHGIIITLFSLSIILILWGWTRVWDWRRGVF